MSDLRRDPISGNWVVISPDEEAGVKLDRFVRFETPREDCPFCPGNERETGHNILLLPSENGDHEGSSWSLRVIPNRLPVLRTERALEREGIGMFDRITGVGAHEIIIESPRHDLLLHEYPVERVEQVLTAWRDRVLDLSKDTRLRYISIFRNQGRRSGARMSHPHSQLIATPVIPVGIRGELSGAREYYEYKERCAFCDLVDQEREEKVRLVTQNRGFIAFCPFASRNPFEVWILPRVHSHRYETLNSEELSDLAEALKQVAIALAGSLLQPDLNVVLKTSPSPKPRRDQWTTLEADFHWHIEVIPRITRFSGYELATGMFVNPTPPESAAAYLRDTLFDASRRRDDAKEQ